MRLLWTCREITISPTMQEILCMLNPYLPANRPQAPHHLPSNGITRLLDTHFRLLRHDLMGPLFDSIHRMLAKSGGEPDGTPPPFLNT